MIRYSLACCACEGEFEAWFRSSDDFETQRAAALLTCPFCGSADVKKQIMAPAVRTGTDTSAKPARRAEVEFEAFAAKARAYVANNCDYVGKDFATIAKATWQGEGRESARPIWGETTPGQRQELADEGVAVLPLPSAFTPPTPVDKDKLN